MKIDILNKNVSNMIAAGEVVERPASVIKELVENSIDSGADNIIIEIKKAGKTYMRVTDNGCGMLKEDARLCFHRHATSKMSTEADLFNISSLGFRGEALAAISSVSKVELLTAVSMDYYGTRILMQGGEEILCEEVGLPVGTTMIVKDLFYNTPVRLNFMKTDATESAVIVSLVHKFAIANSNISFRLIVDNKTVFSSNKDSSLKDILYTVLGKEINENLLKVTRKDPTISIEGYAASPRCSRSNRNYQLFFVNNRIVKNKTITAAVDRAYKNQLMTGKHAIVVLKITMNYNMVDVNIHPTKSEVKFLDESRVFDAVFYSLKDALIAEKPPIATGVNTNSIENNEFLSSLKEASVISQNLFVNNDYDGPYYTISDFYRSGDKSFLSDLKNKEYNEVEYENSVFYEVQDRPVENKSLKSRNPISDDLFKESISMSRFEKLSEMEFSNEYPDGLPESFKESFIFKPEVTFKYIGELFETYIIVESGSSMLLIDKHAAHERILFNKIYEKYKSGDRYSQNLLVGIPVTLTPEEAQLARENCDKLSKLGYNFDEFGNNDFIIRSVPYITTPIDAADSFIEMISILSDNGDDMLEFETNTIKMLACRSAIKAGNKSTEEELKKFVKDLLNSENVNYCPHGRPIYYEYTKNSIEKAFKRIV